MKTSFRTDVKGAAFTAGSGSRRPAPPRSSRREEAHFSSTAGAVGSGESEPPRAGCYEVAVKLADFGIGPVVSQECLAGITRAGFTATMIGAEGSSQSGTQMYMAPELLAGKAASAQSDIYSLGVVLFQLLVGDLSHPLTMDWADEISDALHKEDLKRCFAGKPEERFGSAAELAVNLRSLTER